MLPWAKQLREALWATIEKKKAYNWRARPLSKSLHSKQFRSTNWPKKKGLASSLQPLISGTGIN